MSARTASASRSFSSIARFAGIIAGASAAALALGAGAASADSTFVVDRDAAQLSNGLVRFEGATLLKSGGHLANGSVTHTHDGQFIRSQVVGGIYWNSTNSGCGYVRATFTSATGQVTTIDSPRVCSVGVVGAGRNVTITSPASQDMVKVRLQTFAAVDSVDPGTQQQSADFIVGDAPDSLGTATRLDSDPMTAHSSTGVLVLNAGATYSVSNGDVRGRFLGTLRWDDSMPGSEARVLVTYTYADGTASQTTVGHVVRDGTETQTVLSFSLPGKDVRTVNAKVISSSAGVDRASFGALASTFGDG